MKNNENVNQGLKNTLQKITFCLMAFRWWNLTFFFIVQYIKNFFLGGGQIFYYQEGKEKYLKNSLEIRKVIG